MFRFLILSPRQRLFVPHEELGVLLEDVLGDLARHGTAYTWPCGPEARGRQPHDGILARQADTADGHTRERLGLDDPAELPVVRAEIPLSFTHQVTIPARFLRPSRNT